MKKMLHRRPSPSIVVAFAALVIAMSGTALATTKLVSGDGLIKQDSLSGNRLRYHTLGGAQINSSALGTVPNATNASHALTADKATTATSATNATNAANATNATSATNATNATTAANATELGGVPASNYLTTTNETGTGGVTVESGSANVTLFTAGVFTLKLICVKSGSAESLQLTGSSSVANSWIDGTLESTANTAVDLGSGYDIASTTSAVKNHALIVDLEAPGASGAVLTGADGVNSLGTAPDCWAHFVGLH